MLLNSVRRKHRRCAAISSRSRIGSCRSIAQRFASIEFDKSLELANTYSGALKKLAATENCATQQKGDKAKADFKSFKDRTYLQMMRESVPHIVARVQVQVDSPVPVLLLSLLSTATTTTN